MEDDESGDEYKGFHGESKKGFDSSRPTFFGSTFAKPPAKTRKKEEQAEAVEKVLRANQSGKGSHYRVLNLPTNASRADIRKAYTKQALKIHPDKNKAPNADDIIKATDGAYEVLES